MLAIVATGASQTTAAAGGMIAAAPQPTVQAPFGRPSAAARREGCEACAAEGRLGVFHVDGLAGTDKGQFLCLPPPAWENHCILQDERGTPAAGHDDDLCCPSPD